MGVRIVCTVPWTREEVRLVNAKLQVAGSLLMVAGVALLYLDALKGWIQAKEQEGLESASPPSEMRMLATTAATAVVAVLAWLLPAPPR